MYMLECDYAEGERKTALVALDPLLSEYESEYSYIFSQVWKGSGETAGSIQKIYHYPNIARRVLEAFFAFRLPHSAHTWNDSRYQKNMHGNLDEFNFDKAKTNRIVNFLNAHSHNARADDFVDHNECLLLETPAVLADVLAFMKHADEGHYVGMMKLLSATTPN